VLEVFYKVYLITAFFHQTFSIFCIGI